MKLQAIHCISVEKIYLGIYSIDEYELALE